MNRKNHPLYSIKSLIAFWWANKFLWILQVNKSMKAISYFISNSIVESYKYNEFVAQSRLLLNTHGFDSLFPLFYFVTRTKFQIDKWDFDALSNFKISLGVCYPKMEPICIISAQQDHDLNCYIVNGLLSLQQWWCYWWVPGKFVNLFGIGIVYQTPFLVFSKR